MIRSWHQKITCNPLFESILKIDIAQGIPYDTAYSNAYNEVFHKIALE